MSARGVQPAAGRPSPGAVPAEDRAQRAGLTLDRTTFRRPSDEAGVLLVRLHDVRHGAATIALAAGADLKGRTGLARPLQQSPPAGRLHPPSPRANARVLHRNRLGGLIREYSRSHTVTGFSASTGNHSPPSTCAVYTLRVYWRVVNVSLPLLRLLEREPSRGCDRKRCYGACFGRGRRRLFGQVYSTPGRLARDGEVVPGRAGPDSVPARRASHRPDQPVPGPGACWHRSKADERRDLHTAGPRGTKDGGGPARPGRGHTVPAGDIRPGATDR
jgi:hypothetical protein